MNDGHIIAMAVRDHANGQVISDLQAKVIANAWHGGQSSRFYSFASTGTIDNSDGQLGLEFDRADTGRMNPELNALRAFIQDRGTRGRQDGWSEISW
jgi:hypothetical protein